MSARQGWRKFEAFERVFVEKADSLESTVVNRSALLTETLQERTSDATRVWKAC